MTLDNETTSNPVWEFRIARQADAQDVLSLYENAKNSAFCVWDDSYPGMVNIMNDLATDDLYVLTHKGRIVGAVYVAAENEMNEFDCWSHRDARELARVVVANEYQGNGLSYEMVLRVTQILQKTGCRAIHLSVAKSNLPACKTYLRAEFKTVGEAHMYGGDYYLMERAI